MLAIDLPEDVAQRLAELSRRTGKSQTSVAREAILEHIGELEDLYLAEQQMVEIQSGRMQTVPLGDVLKRYGLED